MSRAIDVLLVAETVAVFCIARHYGASFREACHATVIVNGLLTLGFLAATLRNLRRLR